MGAKFDVVIVGGGHNGLVCGGYLARSGQRVLVLERRSVVGGLSADREFFKGFRGSIPNSPGSLEPKVVLDLELKKFGLEFTRPDPSLVVPFPDGRAMVAWRDRQKTADEIAKFSKKDVTAYAEFFEYLNDFGRRIGISLFDNPPRLRDVMARLKTDEDEDAFAKVFLGSLKDLLDSRLESEELKAVIAAISVTSNMVGPRTPGSPYLLMMRPFSLASGGTSDDHDPRKQYLRGSTGLPIGGMGSVTKAMRASLEAYGGVVRTDCEVSRIVGNANAIQGVELETGEFIEARVVVSNLHPKTTMVDLLDCNGLEREFIDPFDQLPKRGSAFKIALALDGLPVMSAAPAGMERLYAGCQFRLSPSLDYMERAYDDAKYGRASKDPIILGLIPSVSDPEMAPPGKHILSANVWHAPIDLAEGDWETERDRFGNRCIDVMSEYMPNLKDLIIDKKFLSPKDLEQEYGLRDANVMHLDMMPAQMFSLRPVPGWASYQMPVPGLYLCGSGTWPGGTVSGVPGHNASQKIISDLKALRVA
ncbi:phytoene desaturase family protein [Roseovarius sp. ZX-A-9]|uniref:phytoene desaturase family protein n=1 Tax=Roseovarius sp. ZX-A-9 TaxID=3014783 RepID=UPI00233065D7|nr:NAD(P)/FAD-dependent oxidoreductase [Roseovarius sp. ZX-A-9]